MTPLPSSDLNDPVTFPTFYNLPHEDELEGDYHSLFGMYSSPYRHWCFLGTIVDKLAFMRLRLDVKDKKGNTIPVAFYTDDRGDAFARSCLPGHTLAVLYAQQHNFFDGTVGLRIEDNDMVKISPYSMEEILDASRFVFRQGKGDKCDCCTKKSKAADGALKKCSRCKQASYCGKECQERDWRESHKSTCKILKQLEWFLEKDWEKFNGGQYFHF
ncbi:hypothetical protein BJ138DRAFT_1116390 [Hygrophoropsis aurantiaca]|uniref:Uncharacterized protein n=1 Tax=Hygrophoropsis aurantiaca TaxID=72124 RepID=A0ACB8A410_9AGAM|nr:hypothetical protein BJ138DRAFT_1116390 [Hygrophoropsis aurantiaca]